MKHITPPFSPDTLAYEASGASPYYMQISTSKESVRPDEEVEYSFIPRRKGNEAPVELTAGHGNKIHLIVVSDDLSYFNHLHPQPAMGGSFLLKTSFPAPGKYRLYADYTAADGTTVVNEFDAEVAGNPPVARTFEMQKLSGTSGRYTLSLHPVNEVLTAGVEMLIRATVKKDGKHLDADTLENYLGNRAHMVLISAREKEYLHVHPTVRDGKLDIYTTFVKPGVHRGWVQFMGDGKLHTIDFTLQVARPADEKNHNRPAAVSHGHHKH